MLRRLLIGLLFGRRRPVTRQAAPVYRSTPDLLDGRECDRVAYDRLVALLQQYFGELPAGRLLYVDGASNPSCAWVAFQILSPGGHTIHMRKEFPEAKTITAILAWWEAAGLKLEYGR